ncbi:MAG: InlB B-repeat-containing protein [Firmicutes bacterium]|nr:InlB B-repeat-containing protein [Bacillota bacterium]
MTKKNFLKTMVVFTFALAMMGAILIGGMSPMRVHAAPPVGNWINYVASDFEDGDGSSEYPWIITTPNQLALMAQRVNLVGVAGDAYQQGHFLITENIDLAGHYWTPISVNITTANIFQGVLKALPNVEIRNMTVNSYSSVQGEAGFFGAIGTGATVEGLNFTNAYVHGTSGAGAGVLAGRLEPSNSEVNETRISNITVDGDSIVSTIDGIAGIRTGGIIGSAGGSERYDIIIEDVEFNGTIRSENHGVGGVLGQSGSAHVNIFITEAHVDATFELEAAVMTGGIVGSFGPSNNFGVRLDIINSSVEMDVVWNSTNNAAAIGGVVGTLISTINTGLDMTDRVRNELIINNVEVSGNIDFVDGWAQNRGRVVGSIQGIYNHVIIEDVWVNQLTNNHPTQWTTHTARPSIIPAGLVTTFVGWMTTNAGQIAASQNIVDIRQVSSIAFNTGVGGDAVDSMPFIYNTVPAFTRNLPLTEPTVGNGNFNFLGWSRTQDNVVAYASGASIIVGSGITTLYAVTDQIMHPVRFYNEGVEYTVRSIGSGENLTEFFIPETGPASHTFSHWANYAQGTTPPGTVIEFRSGDILQINASLTLHAHYTADTYTITFESRGGSAVTSVDRDFGTDFELTGAQAPTLLFNTFLGWATSEQRAQDDYVDYMIGEDVEITGNRTLWAVWELTTFTLSFNIGASTSTVPNITGTQGQTFELVNEPTLAHNDFKGWALTSGGAIAHDTGDFVSPYRMTTESPIVPENWTLFAVFELTEYTVTFNERGGSAVANVPMTHGTLTLGSAHTSSLANHDFLGWAITEQRAIDGYVDYVVGEDSVQVNGNRTLWAVWQLTTFTITFDVRGGDAVTAETGNYEGTFYAPNATRQHYNFLGWATSNQNAIDLEVEYTVGAEVTITGNRTLFAVWQLTTYTVAFEVRGGNIVTAETGNNNDTFNAPNASRNHHNFLGWAISEQDAIDLEVEYVVGDTVTITGNRTLWAVWQLTTYTVTFNVGSGNAVTAETGTINQTFYAPSTSLTHHDFMGWATSNGGAVVYIAGVEVTITGNRILWAVFEATQYTVTFNVRNGNAVAAETGNHNDTFYAPNATRGGYNFVGWALTEQDAIAGDFEYEVGDEITITGNRTLWAVWQEVTRYTFTFNTGEGTDVDDVIRSQGSFFTFVGAPTRAGYSFAGWATTAGGEVIHRAGDTIEVTGDMEFHAVWIPVINNNDGIDWLIIAMIAGFGFLVLVTVGLIVIARKRNNQGS